MKAFIMALHKKHEQHNFAVHTRSKYTTMRGKRCLTNWVAFGFVFVSDWWIVAFEPDQSLYVIMLISAKNSCWTYWQTYRENFFFVLRAITEAVAGGTVRAASRPTSPVPNTAADVAIEIDEDPPDAADSEPLVC